MPKTLICHANTAKMPPFQEGNRTLYDAVRNEMPDANRIRYNANV
jgi:hypothetical protein